MTLDGLTALGAAQANLGEMKEAGFAVAQAQAQNQKSTDVVAGGENNDDPTPEQNAAVKSFIADMRATGLSDQIIAQRLSVSVEQVGLLSQGHGLTATLFESIANFAKNNLSLDIRAPEYINRVDYKNTYFASKNISDAQAQLAAQKVQNGQATTADALVVADWVAQSFYSGLEHNLGKPLAHSAEGQMGYCGLASELAIHAFGELGATTHNLGTDFLSHYSNVVSDKFTGSHAFSLIEVKVTDRDKPLYIMFDPTQRQFDKEKFGPAVMLNETTQGQHILNDLYRQGYTVVDEVGLETYFRAYNENRPVYSDINDFWADAQEDAEEPSTKREVEQRKQSVEKAYDLDRPAQFEPNYFGPHYRKYNDLGEAMLDGYRPSVINAQRDSIGKAASQTVPRSVAPITALDYKAIPYVAPNVRDADAQKSAQNIKQGQATKADVTRVSDWVAQSFYQGLAQSRGDDAAHTPYGQRGYCGLAADLPIYAFGELDAQTMDLSTTFLGVYSDEGKISFDKAHTFCVVKVDVKDAEKPVLVLFDMTLHQFDDASNSPAHYLNQSQQGQNVLNDLYRQGYAVVDEAALDTYFKAYNGNKPVYADFDQFYKDVANDAEQDPPQAVLDIQRQRIQASALESRLANYKTIDGANRVYADLGEASLDGFRPSALHATQDHVALVRSGAKPAATTPDILPPEPFDLPEVNKTATGKDVAPIDYSKPLDYKHIPFEPKNVSDVQASGSAQKVKNGTATQADVKNVSDWVATQFYNSLGNAIGTDIAQTPDGNKGYCGLAKKLTMFAFTEINAQTYELGPSFFHEYTDADSRTFNQAHVFTLVEVDLSDGNKTFYLFDPTLRQFDDFQFSPSARLNETPQGRIILNSIYRNGYAQVDEAGIKTYFNSYNDNKPVYSDLNVFWSDLHDDADEEDYKPKFEKESRAIEEAKTLDRKAQFELGGHRYNRRYSNLGEATLDGYRPSVLNAPSDRAAQVRAKQTSAVEDQSKDQTVQNDQPKPVEKSSMQKALERYFGSIVDVKQQGKKIKINLGVGALGESKVGYIQVSLKQPPLNIRPRTYQDTDGNHWVIIEESEVHRIFDTKPQDLKYHRRMHENELADHLKPQDNSKPPSAEDFRDYNTGTKPRNGSADPFYNLDGTPAFPMSDDIGLFDLSRPIEARNLNRTQFPETWPTQEVVTHEVREVKTAPARIETIVKPTSVVNLPYNGITLEALLNLHVDGFAQMTPEQKQVVTTRVLQLNKGHSGVASQISDANLMGRTTLSLKQPLSGGQLILPNVRAQVEVQPIRTQTVEVRTRQPVKEFTVFPGMDTDGSEALQRSLASEGIDAEVKSVEGETKIYPKNDGAQQKLETKFAGQSTQTQVQIAGAPAGDTQTAITLNVDAGQDAAAAGIAKEQQIVADFMADAKAEGEALKAEVDKKKAAWAAEFEANNGQVPAAPLSDATPAPSPSADMDGQNLFELANDSGIATQDNLRAENASLPIEPKTGIHIDKLNIHVKPVLEGKVANTVQKIDSKVTTGSLYATLLDDTMAFASFSMDAMNPLYSDETRKKADEMAAYYKQKVIMLGGIGIGVKIVNKLGELVAKNFIPGAAVVTKGVTATVEVDMVLAQYAKGEASWTRVWTTFVAAGVEFGVTAGTSMLGLPGGALGEGARVGIVEALKFAGVPEGEVASYGIMAELIKAASQGNLGAKKVFEQLIGQDQTAEIERRYKQVHPGP